VRAVDRHGVRQATEPGGEPHHAAEALEGVCMEDRSMALPQKAPELVGADEVAAGGHEAGAVAGPHAQVGVACPERVERRARGHQRGSVGACFLGGMHLALPAKSAELWQQADQVRLDAPPLVGLKFPEYVDDLGHGRALSGLG
jgi:hypothetical protein